MPSHTLSKEEFEAYVNWLKLETSEAETGTLELVASRVEAGELYLLKFKSFDSLCDWAKETFPRSTPGDDGPSTDTSGSTPRSRGPG